MESRARSILVLFLSLTLCVSGWGASEGAASHINQEAIDWVELHKAFRGGESAGLRVLFPPGVKAEEVQVHRRICYAVRELGIGGPEGAAEFGLRGSRWLVVPVKVLRAFAHRPGYEIAWIDDADINQPWRPIFKPAVTATLEGRLTNEHGQPAAGMRLNVLYRMSEAMRFFGYNDGMTPELALGSTVVQPDGTFALKLPVFEEDPFMIANADYMPRRRDGSRPAIQRRAGLAIDGWELRYRRDGATMLWPDTITLKAKYDEPLNLRIIRRPRISGRIGEDFRRAKGITGLPSMAAEARGDVLRALLSAEVPGTFGSSYMTHGSRVVKRSHNCELKPDWSFSVLLSPGTYDIVLREYGFGSRLKKEIVIREGIVLGDGSDVRIELERE